MYPAPTKCPVCGSENLNITRVNCTNCDMTMEGHFDPPYNPFASLSEDQMQFIQAFIRCEGRFTRLEEELNLSYPTLRNRLHDVIRALGYEPGKEETPPKLSPEDRRLILEELEQGKITSAEAQALLRGRDPGELE